MTDRNIIGVYTISNTISIVIYEIEYGIDDYVIVGWSGKEETEKCKIKYEDEIEENEENNRAYFMYGMIKVYLDECMRTNL